MISPNVENKANMRFNVVNPRIILLQYVQLED